jgi:negative regulator of replication initiation
MTTVEVSEEVWRHLNSLKGPGDSFDDVLRRELDIGDSADPSSGAEPRGERVREPMQNAAEPEIVLPDELPHSIDRSEARRVIGRVLELVDEHGPLERTQIVERLDESHALGYDMANRKGSWWRKIVKPGLKQNGCEYQNGRGYYR